MEALLGFKEQTNDEVIFDKSKSSFKLVPWINWEEWDFVKSSVFSSSPEFVATALKRITAWRSRGCLPVVIEVTASIIEIQQKDPFFRNDLRGKAVDSEEMLAMLYCMAIMRLVNCVIEKTRKKKEVSIAQAAEAIGIPRLLIDIRHEGSHRDLPSLHLVRLASVKAVDWLKAYYWEPQMNFIPNLGDTATNRRSEIKHKLCELAFCLKAKKDTRSDSSVVKGKRVTNLERFSSPGKFLSLLAVKHTSLKSSGSKKQANKLLKNVVHLYSSSSGEVVEVLLELLLEALESLGMVDNAEDQDSHGTENMPSLFVLWKPVLFKLLNKQPELVWNLLKAFLEDLEIQAIKHQTEEQILTDPIAHSRHSEQLVILFEWLIKHFMKSAHLSDSATETERSVKVKNYSKAAAFDLLRKCLVLTFHGNHRLMTSALALARMMENQSLLSKLEKLLPICVPHVDADESVSVDDNISESFLSHGQEMIDEAAANLERIKNHSKKKNGVETQINQGKNRWVKVQSWTPCPIGMLPHRLGSSGQYPNLNNKADDRESSETEKPKGQPEFTQSSHKRVSHSDNDDLDDVSAKRLKETVHEFVIDDLKIPTSEDVKGHLMMGGVWKEVREEEVSAIASAIRILV